MSLIRKVFWPAAFAIGFLVFLGALSSPSPIHTASIDTNMVSIDNTTVLTEVNADAVSTVSTKLLGERATIKDAIGQNVSGHTLYAVIALTSIVAVALLNTTFGKSFALMLSSWVHLMTISTTTRRLVSGLMLDTRGRFMTRIGGGSAYAKQLA